MEANFESLGEIDSDTSKIRERRERHYILRNIEKRPITIIII
jgi:hypothetical protein